MNMSGSRCRLSCAEMSAQRAGRVGGSPPTKASAPLTSSQAAHSRALLQCQAAKGTVIIPARLTSPYNGASWGEVFDLMRERFAWEQLDLSLDVFDVDKLSTDAGHQQALSESCQQSDMLVAVALQDNAAQQAVQTAIQMHKGPIMLAMDSAEAVQQCTSLGGLPVRRVPGFFLSLLSKLPGSWGKAAKVWPTLQEMWDRRSSDDLAFLLMLALNDFVTPIPSTQVNQGDARSFVDMCTNCRKEIVACVQDPECKKALDGLAACGLNDQVCSYRVLASYESPLLENFSRCILQKHNCLRNHADIPMTPAPQPLQSFRGQPLTHEAAEDIFIGNLAETVHNNGGQSFSWRVAAGKNPAYDFFPCQYQLWYRTRGKAMWYDPIFKVITLDGRETWRRRHYKVRRADVPGTFFFSVLDNGVTSNEFWRIMDCAEDFTWAVFYYSGAASVAGITYRGALVCTPSGHLPEGDEVNARVDAALRECGIRRWEMFDCDNDCCADAPLSVPESGDTRLRALEGASA